MIKRTLMYLLYMSLIFSLLISCSSNKKQEAPKPQVRQETKAPKLQVRQETKARNDTKGMMELNKFYEKSGTNTEKELAFQLPAVSGPVTAVPWENDNEFKKAYTDAGSPVRMAAFCTVLKDPLPGEEYNVHLAAKLLKGIIIKPGEIFSQNGNIGPYTSDRGFKEGPVYIGTRVSKSVGGGVCKIASTLYNVSVLSNLEIVERHTHDMPVPYVPYGQDATVSYGALDFRFRNDTGYPVVIWAQGVENTLFIAFYGKKEAPRVEWHHEILDKTKAPTKYVKNPNLPHGTQKTRIEGMDGADVQSWVIITKADGTTARKKRGRSSYRPLPFVIERNR